MRMKMMGVIGMLGVAGMMAGCMGERKIETRALAPTEGEARAMAEAQLNDQTQELNADKGSAGEYMLEGSPHFSTKVVVHGDGADVYEVTGREMIKRGK